MGRCYLVTHVWPIQTAHHERTLGSAPTHKWESTAKNRNLLVDSLPAGRNGQGHSLQTSRTTLCKAFSSKYCTLPQCLAVGADPCVRPAETCTDFLGLGRMHTISVFGKMGPFGKILPLLPTFVQLQRPTTGGHLGPPLRTGGLVILFILLQYFYKYKGQTCENFLHTPTK